MKICIAQTHPIKGDIKKNIEAHKRLISLAILNNADIIVFPELSLTGFEPELAKQLATTKDDERFVELQEISNTQGIIICVGVPIKSNQGILISMLIFQPNKPIEIYSKQHLHNDEFTVFAAGNHSFFLEKETTKIAFAICYETSIKQHAEYAHNKNATVYMASVLNSTKSIDADIERLSKIASGHKMTVFMSNYVGISGGYKCAGKSSIWNNKGEIIAQLNSETEGILIYDNLTDNVFKKNSFPSKSI